MRFFLGLPRVLLYGTLLALGFACSSSEKKEGTKAYTIEYKHIGPNFKADIPPGFTAGKDKFEDRGFSSVSIKNDDFEEIFFSWNNLRSKEEALSVFERHRNKKDITKIVEEGSLPDGKGKFIHTIRGEVVFIHSLVFSGPIGIECMVSNPTSDVMKNVCKTLASY